MSFFASDAGHRQSLKNRLKKALAATALATVLVSATWMISSNPLEAAGETRTLSMFHIHTKESLTVTYMQNGKYIPSAMKKINYFMRDWRKNKSVTIDPKTIDLMWELHTDLGSKAPIHIVCGLRTSGTNKLLKRIGRNVAKNSQHTKGKAIDFYFPDVPSVKIRNSALVRRVGGVGYYRSSGGPTGFIHVDTGNVRHWGPAISKSQWASIMREGKKTVGRRLTRSNSIAVASIGNDEKSPGIIGRLFGGRKKEVKIISNDEPKVVEEEVIPEQPNYEGDNEDLAELAEQASETFKPKKPMTAPEQAFEEPSDVPVASVAKSRKKPVEEIADGQLAALSQTAATEEAAEAVADEEVTAGIKRGPPVPRPRMKPAEILNLAAAGNGELLIEPANASPESNIVGLKKISRDNKLLAKKAAEAMAEQEQADLNEAAIEQASNSDSALGNDESNEGVSGGKGDFAAEIASGQAQDTPLIRTAIANPIDSSSVVMPSDQLIRLNGSPQPMDVDQGSVLPQSAKMDSEMPLSPEEAAVTAELATNADGKSDLLLVEREGKGNMQEVPESIADDSTTEPMKLGQLAE